MTTGACSFGHSPPASSAAHVPRKRRPAVVCANDEMAAGAMAAAHDRGLRLPEQLSIVGFDDAPISRYVYPKLSTVHYPITDMSRVAARWVLKNVYRQDGLEVPQQVFEPNFVARDSIGRPAS